MILRFLQINIRGLNLKQKELLRILNDHKADVVILNELKIHNYYSKETFQLPGWIIYSESHRSVVCINNSISLDLKVEHIKLGLDHQAMLSLNPRKTAVCDGCQDY